MEKTFFKNPYILEMKITVPAEKYTDRINNRLVTEEANSEFKDIAIETVQNEIHRDKMTLNSEKSISKL